MKRFFVSLIATLLAFTAGLVTASSWTSEREFPELVAHVEELCKQNTPPPPPAAALAVPFVPHDYEFGHNGLRLVSERVKLNSEILAYDIDVTYPQLIGTAYTNETMVRKANQHLKDVATKLYQWPLKSSEQLGYSQSRSGIRNTVNFTYNVGLATDAFVNVNFMGDSYNGATQRNVQENFSVNYDLDLGKDLKLSDLFKPGSKYMEFISRYSMDALSKLSMRGLTREALRPSAENFSVWQITADGITFNFNACKVANCSEGEMIVQIPFTELKPMLNTDIPARFDITYP